jgi:hypothetical protein
MFGYNQFTSRRFRYLHERVGLFIMVDLIASTYDTRTLTAADVERLADRTVERAISALFDVPLQVRRDMLLAAGCLGMLARTFPNGVTVDVLRAVTTMTATDAAQLAGKLVAMEDSKTYAGCVSGLQLECVTAGRLIRAMLRQVHSSEVFMLTSDRPPTGARLEIRDACQAVRRRAVRRKHRKIQC